MDGYLKLSTAATIWVGPYHSTDGLTAKSNLKISAGVFQIAKNGAAYANKTHTSVVTTLTAPGGWYGTKLSVADTNTPGILYYKSRVSSYPPVWGSFVVLPKLVYDSVISGSDYLQVDAVQVAGATPDTKADIAASVKSAGVNYAVSTGLVKKLAASTLSTTVFKSTAIPGQGAPPVQTDPLTMTSYLYKFMRNKTVVNSTAGTITVYADNGTTADHKASIADVGGSFTRYEFGTGA